MLAFIALLFPLLLFPIYPIGITTFVIFMLLILLVDVVLKMFSTLLTYGPIPPTD